MMPQRRILFPCQRVFSPSEPVSPLRRRPPAIVSSRRRFSVSNHQALLAILLSACALDCKHNHLVAAYRIGVLHLPSNG